MPIVNTAAEAKALLEKWQEEAKNTVDAAGESHRSTSDYAIEISEALDANRRNEIQEVRDRLQEIKDKFDLEDENPDPTEVVLKQYNGPIAYDEDGDEVHETTEADEINRVIDLYDAALQRFYG